MKYVLGAKCVKCGREYAAVPDLTTCSCGGILDIQYDYAALRREAEGNFTQKWLG